MFLWCVPYLCACSVGDLVLILRTPPLFVAFRWGVRTILTNRPSLPSSQLFPLVPVSAPGRKPQIMLTFDWERKGWALIDKMRPDIMHVTSPGFLVLPSLFYARFFRVPLLFSYHTHLPLYGRTYCGWIPGVEAMSYALLRYAHNKADLTLCTSPQMKQQLTENGIERVDVWQKGIDVEVGGRRGVRPCLWQKRGPA